MAIYREDIVDIELNSGSIHRSFLHHAIGEGDNMANRFGVRLFRNGTPVSAESCVVAGVFFAPDGEKYAINETSYPGSTGKSGNSAWVQLPEICYAVIGQFSLAVKLSGSGVEGTMRIIDGTVSETGEAGAVVPTSTIPTTEDIIEAYEEAIENVGKAVRFDVDQSLNNSQKATARKNIGATGLDITELPAIPANSDANSYTTPGAWRIDLYDTAQTIANLPVNAVGLLKTQAITSNNSYLIQTFARANTTDVYMREYGAGTFGEWVKITKSSEFSNLETRALKKYTWASEASLLELPENVFTSKIGSELQTILGSGFPYTLKHPGATYIIKKYDFSSSFILVEIMSYAKDEAYFGTTALSHPTTFDWLEDADNGRLTRVEKKLDTEVSLKDYDEAVQIYTDFDFEAGWYWSDGTILPETITQGLVHTNRMAVKPNTVYYFAATWEHTCYGAFFDEAGNFLAPLLNTDISEHTYDIPDKEPDYEGKPVYTYVNMYKFTTPAGAKWFSYNFHNQSDTVEYRQYISSVPVYMHTGTGNLVIHKSDPEYGYFSKRKLCIIGPSYVMIDRLLRTGHFDAFDSTQTQYVVGFQEWLLPFWKEIKSFGYSWATFSNYNVEDGAPKRSIYARIVTDETDISGFDDYIITSNSNDLGANRSPGTVTTYSDLGDNTTYIGAVRQIMEYIYQANPAAKIYIATHHHHGSQWRSSTNWQTMLTYNDEIRNLGKIMGCPVIDLEKDSGFNQHTATKWHYDYDGTNLYSGVHANHVGNKELGLCYRRQIVGI